MPISNLFKNSTYYWGFAAYVSYFVNHPAYTSPPDTRAFVVFPLAMICQWANYRCGAESGFLHRVMPKLLVSIQKDVPV